VIAEPLPQSSDEIDLLDLVQTLWAGKFKIVGFVLAFVLGVLGVLFFQPAPPFIAKTEIKPILSEEAERYRLFNDLGFIVVTPEGLRALFIERLDSRQLFEEAFKKYKLLNRGDYKTDEKFEAALSLLAASIDILAPVNVDGKEKGESRKHWTISFEYNDHDKWQDALREVSFAANEEVRGLLKLRFENTFRAAMQKRRFGLEDINTAMENARKDFDRSIDKFVLKKNFELQDLNIAIGNAFKDYDRKTSDRLAFLKEQASIARKLGVSKNTIEAQTFTTQTGVLANVKTDTPFYLRGYEAIEKEIELIQGRQNKKAFIAELIELERKKRALEQDKTLERAELNKAFLEAILELEQKKRALEQDRTLERAETLFAETPIMADPNFSAVSFDVDATDYQSKTKRLLMVALAMVMGAMVGAVFVLISNAMKTRQAAL
jgi:LPS O-antigen subunit length determinant protein (WzzB/FepE family)